jgi:hypothetical protein
VVVVAGADVGVTVVAVSSVTPEEQAAATTNTAKTDAVRLIRSHFASGAGAPLIADE